MEARHVIAMFCKEDRLFFDTLPEDEQRMIIESIAPALPRVGRRSSSPKQATEPGPWCSSAPPPDPSAD